jgi:hypothetical protein
MTVTFTEENKAALKDWLATHKLTHGVGSKEAACTVAAINMALDGRVIDHCPPCMSPVLHSWIIPIQDVIPLDLLNDGRWAALIPEAAGTNDGKDDLRIEIILNHMWSVVLPQLQPLADENGFGAEWRRMCQERTEVAANAARIAAWSADAEAAAAAEAEAAAQAAAEAEAAGRAADAAAHAAARAAYVAAMATVVCVAIDPATFWNAVDPWSLLARLINPEESK